MHVRTLKLLYRASEWDSRTAVPRDQHTLPPDPPPDYDPAEQEMPNPYDLELRDPIAPVLELGRGKNLPGEQDS